VAIDSSLPGGNHVGVDTGYPLAIRLDGRMRFLLWVSGDGEDSVVAEGGLALAFDNLGALSQHAAETAMRVEGDPRDPVDLDAAERWCSAASRPDPVLLLETWNLCWDVSNGTGAPFEHRTDELTVLYDKLFHANNLPSMTPPGERWEPEWSQDEVPQLQRLISTGVSMIRASLDPA